MIMTAKEYLESKQFASAGKVNTKDALIAVELAYLEGRISVLSSNNHSHGEAENDRIKLNNIKQLNNIA